MQRNMATCADPSNATECLLRALLDEANATRALLHDIRHSSSAFNWDPLNFAFTAAIGALALLIACITVFQGLLAAGPGRIKASKVAIGPFARGSRSRFDFTEIGLRTVAFVPALNQVNQIHRIERDFSHHSCCSKCDPAVGRTESAASWLRLLVELGISDPRLWSHIARPTDNLPADISAAPAAGLVSFLAHLAAVADDDCTVERRPDSRFVTVIGKSSQLTFRDHPILGSVAMYETYRDSPALQESHSIGTKARIRAAQLNLSNAHSIGVVETAHMLDLSRGLLRCRYLGYEVTQGSIQLSFGLLLQKLNSTCKHDHLNKNLSSVLYGGRGSYGARLTTGYIYVILFFTSVPSLVRAFPSSLLGLQAAMIQISSLVSVWRKGVVDVTQALEDAVEGFGGTFSAVSMAAYPFYIISARTRHLSNSSWVEDPPGAGWCTSNIHADFQRGEHDLLYGIEIIQLCKDWIEEIRQKGTPLREMVDQDTIKVKDKLLTAVYLVDDWIRHHGREEAICAALAMIMDIEANLGVHAAREMTDNVHAGDSNDPLEEDPATHEQLRLNLLKQILAYRAILFGALLELSADTSCIVDRAFPDSIVKIL